MTTAGILGLLRLWWNEYLATGSKESVNHLLVKATDALDQPERYQYAVCYLIAREIENLELEANALTKIRLQDAAMYEVLTTKGIDRVELITKMLDEDSEENLLELKMHRVEESGVAMQF